MVPKNWQTFGVMILLLKSGNVLARIRERKFFKCLTIRERGPGPRSCHKICFDEKQKLLYVLGRYVDPDAVPSVPLVNDFWMYDVKGSSWNKISRNTKVLNSINS